MNSVSSGLGQHVRPADARRRKSWRLLVFACMAFTIFGLPGMAAATPDPAAPKEASTGTAWRWPLRPAPNEVIRGFDPPADRWSSGHRGVDLRGGVGDEVRAAGAGVVTFAGVLAGRGVITVTHGPLRTTYEPVTAVVAVHDHVDAGDVIGTLGLLGGHCLPRACLHWGLLRGNTYLDPLSLVGAGPVRLLPLHVPVASTWQAPARVPADRSAASGRPADRRAEHGPASPPGARTARAAVVLGGLAAGGVALGLQRRRSRLQ